MWFLIWCWIWIKKELIKKKWGKVNSFYRYYLVYIIWEMRICWGNCEFWIDFVIGFLVDMKV